MLEIGYGSITWMMTLMPQEHAGNWQVPRRLTIGLAVAGGGGDAAQVAEEAGHRLPQRRRAQACRPAPAFPRARQPRQHLRRLSLSAWVFAIKGTSCQNISSRKISDPQTGLECSWCYMENDIQELQMMPSVMFMH